MHKYTGEDSECECECEWYGVVIGIEWGPLDEGVRGAVTDRVRVAGQLRA